MTVDTKDCTCKVCKAIRGRSNEMSVNEHKCKWSGFEGVGYYRLNPGVCVSYTGFEFAMMKYVDFDPFNFKRPALVVHPDERECANDAMEMCRQTLPNLWEFVSIYTVNWVGIDRWMLIGENGIVVSWA